MIIVEIDAGLEAGLTASVSTRVGERARDENGGEDGGVLHASYTSLTWHLALGTGISKSSHPLDLHLLHPMSHHNVVLGTAVCCTSDRPLRLDFKAHSLCERQYL